MLTIKKITLLVTIALSVFVPAGAETNYGFSVSPLFGIIYGRAEEILYKYAGSDQYVSQLLWDLKPLVYTGFAADFGPENPYAENGLVVSGTFKYGLPLKSGVMEDRDWDNKDFDYLTHYSRHETYSRGFIEAGLAAGYSFSFMDILALKAALAFSFTRFSWSGENGYLQYPRPSNDRDYPEWSEDYSKQYLNGPVIQYSQNWFALVPGLSLGWKINSLFALKGNFSYTPLLYCVARDDHLLRSLIFWDEIYFGHFLDGGAEFVFSPAKNFGLALSVSYKHITGTRGKSYVDDTGSGTLARNVYDGGAGYSALDVTLAVRIRAGALP